MTEPQTAKSMRTPLARVRNLESLVQRVKKLEGTAGSEQDEDDDRPDNT